MQDLFPDLGPPPVHYSDRILIGTSGYSFKDWVGPFYPPGTRAADYLRLYTREFGVVEVNSTYYGIPRPRVIEQMEKKTPPGFRFVVKLNQAMTHEQSLAEGTIRDFRAAIEPLQRAGKYDGLLAQFPWSFRRTDANRRHLESLREALPDGPLFAEFRHESWIEPDLAAWLTGIRVGYCAVDEPKLAGLVPPVTMLTAEDAYVRFHGRNASTWWGGDGASRYDWSYREDELREWVEKIADLASQARRTYLFFNNCHAGQAARSAKLMQEMLRQQNLPA